MDIWKYLSPRPDVYSRTLGTTQRRCGPIVTFCLFITALKCSALFTHSLPSASVHSLPCWIATSLQWPWPSVRAPGMSCWYFPVSLLRCCTPSSVPARMLNCQKYHILTLASKILNWKNITTEPEGRVRVPKQTNFRKVIQKAFEPPSLTSFNSATFFLISLLAFPKSRFFAFMLNARISVGKSLSFMRSKINTRSVIKCEWVWVIPTANVICTSFVLTNPFARLGNFVQIPRWRS